jgi:dienelactone hydrolase
MRASDLQVVCSPAEEFRSIKRIYLQYDVEDDVASEAFLLRPSEIQDRLPGILLFHESGPTAFEAAVTLDEGPETSVAARLAKRGYVVLCAKCFIYGKEPMPATNPRNIHKNEVQIMQRRHPRWTGLSRMILDGMRAVDALITFPFVNAAKLGTIGHSLGGKQVLFVMAFDKRIKAGVSSDGGIGGLKLSNWDDIWYLGEEINSEGFPLENHQVLALIAPRAFLLIGGIHDDRRAWPLIAGAMPLWDWFGSPSKIGWFQHSAGHRLPPEAMEESCQFFNRHLGVKAI